MPMLRLPPTRSTCRGPPGEAVRAEMKRTRTKDLIADVHVLSAGLKAYITLLHPGGDQHLQVSLASAVCCLLSYPAHGDLPLAGNGTEHKPWCLWSQFNTAPLLHLE